MSDTQRAAIVTGAAGGIGRALVKGLLGAGIRVAAVDLDAQTGSPCCRNAREQGKRRGAADDRIRSEPRRRGRRHRPAGAWPVRRRSTSWSTTPASAKPPCAPGNWQQPLRFWDITADDWRRFVAVHTTAPLTLTQALVPEMIEKKWGRIVNVTTSLGTMIRNGSPTYGPSKAALEAFSAIMAKDLDGTGVTVNVLVPGGVTNTPMVRRKRASTGRR